MVYNRIMKKIMLALVIIASSVFMLGANAESFYDDAEEYYREVYKETPNQDNKLICFNHKGSVFHIDGDDMERCFGPYTTYESPFPDGSSQLHGGHENLWIRLMAKKADEDWKNNGPDGLYYIDRCKTLVHDKPNSDASSMEKFIHSVKEDHLFNSRTSKVVICEKKLLKRELFLTTAFTYYYNEEKRYRLEFDFVYKPYDNKHPQQIDKEAEEWVLSRIDCYTNKVRADNLEVYDYSAYIKFIQDSDKDENRYRYLDCLTDAEEEEYEISIAPPPPPPVQVNATNEEEPAVPFIIINPPVNKTAPANNTLPSDRPYIPQDNATEYPPTYIAPINSTREADIIRLEPDGNSTIYNPPLIYINITYSNTTYSRDITYSNTTYSGGR